MKPMPDGPNKDDPIRLGGRRHYRRGQPHVWFQDGTLREAFESLPHGVYEGANRYDTDDEYVLHLWRDGQSWDIRLTRQPEGQ